MPYKIYRLSGKRKVKIIIRILKEKRPIIFFLLFSLLVLSFYSETFSASKFKRIKVQNFSNTSKINAVIPILLPEDIKNGNFQMKEGSESQNLLPSYFYQGSKSTIFTQISLKPNEEKTVLMYQKTNKFETPPINPTTSPGTEYLFVNYKNAIIISTEDSNHISFFSETGKMLNSDQKPLLLNKGKWFVLESTTPKLTKVSAEKPIYIFCSTLKEYSDLESMEAGDSDTTTLYGDDLYCFVEKHLFISSYTKTKVTIYDNNNIETWSGIMENEKGIMLDNLKRGAYHLVSDNPITIQFGYLDDENFSLLYGSSKKINAFSFGDLMITSLHPNTKVTVVYGTEKKIRKDYHFKKAGLTQTIPLIEQFSPKKPEYEFVTITFNYPILVFTFSSGNNFGGEYIPGINGLFSDNNFSFITLRVSKEFSKEQKNLIELIGLENNTSVLAENDINQHIILQENSTFVFQSNTPLQKISLQSDKLFQVSQLHNFNTKGLFYWIPPLKDSSVIYEDGDQDSEGIIRSDPSVFQNFIFLFNQKRIYDFFYQISSNNHFPYTIFFSSILLLILLLILLFWIIPTKKNFTSLSNLDEKQNEQPILNETKDSDYTLLKSSDLSQKKDELILIEGIEERMPSLTMIKNEESFNIDVPVIKEIKPETVLEPLKENDIKSMNTTQSFFLSKLLNNKIVLDPGSANRLYIEGKLNELKDIYMVKSSSKKISNEVTDKINKIELSIQDQIKSTLFKDSLNTFEEAGKALALCKKLKIIYYISSYKLPSNIQGIHVIHISDALI